VAHRYTFSDFQKQMEETQGRWNEINYLKEQLEDQIQTSTDEVTKTTAKLVLLLVEQLQPMSAVDSNQFQNGLKEVLDAFTGGKKDG
jgi:hypothetical protein